MPGLPKCTCRYDFKRHERKNGSRYKEAADKNSKESEKFLAENKAETGRKTTASGLQYKIEKVGAGRRQRNRYRGSELSRTLIDGLDSIARTSAATGDLSG